MDSLIKQLLDILSEEKEIYAALLELSERKQEAVLSSALESLDKIIREEQALVAKITEREKARLKCVYAISQLNSVSDMTLSSISAIVPDKERERYAFLCAELPPVLEKLKELNETNRLLIESRLNYVEFVMDTVSPGAAPSYGAQGDGSSSAPLRPNLYDEKV